MINYKSSIHISLSEMNFGNHGVIHTMGFLVSGFRLVMRLYLVRTDLWLKFFPVSNAMIPM